MIPGNPQLPEKKYWNQAARPETGYLSRWTDEMKREKSSRGMLNQSVESLEKKLKKAEQADVLGLIASGADSAPTEMSGDAAARKKAGKRAKGNWDLRRD